MSDKLQFVAQSDKLKHVGHQTVTTGLKQTLDCHLPRVLGFQSGLIPEARFVNLPAPFVHTHWAPPMVQIQLKDSLC